MPLGCLDRFVEDLVISGDLVSGQDLVRLLKPLGDAAQDQDLSHAEIQAVSDLAGRPAPPAVAEPDG